MGWVGALLRITTAPIVPIAPCAEAAPTHPHPPSARARQLQRSTLANELRPATGRVPLPHIAPQHQTNPAHALFLVLKRAAENLWRGVWSGGVRAPRSGWVGAASAQGDGDNRFSRDAQQSADPPHPAPLHTSRPPPLLLPAPRILGRSPRCSSLGTSMGEPRIRAASARCEAIVRNPKPSPRHEPTTHSHSKPRLRALDPNLGIVGIGADDRHHVQTPNTARRRNQEVAARRRSARAAAMSMTPDSSIFLIERDPFRAISARTPAIPAQVHGGAGRGPAAPTTASATSRREPGDRRRPIG